MTTGRRIRIGEQVIEYSLKRSKRRKKTVGIKIAPGIVEVAAPNRTPIREIEGILEKRGNWILEKLESASQEPSPSLLATGESVPFMGKNLTLVVDFAEVRRVSATSDGERLVVLLPSELPSDQRHERIRTALVRWYKSQLSEYLEQRISHWGPMMGRKELPHFLVREQRARWGSCSSDGTLRFSWRLAMVDPELIDSVVVHELAHLEVMNHSPAFWQVVVRAMPDALERRKRLNEAGRWLPL